MCKAHTISEVLSTPHFLTYLFEITGPRNLNRYRSSGRKLMKTKPEQKRNINLGVFTRYFHKSLIWIYLGIFKILLSFQRK